MFAPASFANLACSSAGGSATANRTRARFWAGVLLVFLSLLAGMDSARANIVGSKHDFSARGWGTNQICVFCHTPHNAMAGVTSAPLWNHQLSTATYTLYSSPTMQQAPGQPRGPSKLCLSCHDGTIAINSFGGRTGTDFMSGAANLATNLSNDHPISVFWNHQTVASSGTFCFNCHFGSVPPADQLPFFSRFVECSTCHEPHNRGNRPMMVRRGINPDNICLHCHDK